MYIESLIPLLILESFFVVTRNYRFIVIDLLFRLIFSLIQMVNRIMLCFHLLFHTNIREDLKCIWMLFCVCFRSCEYYLLESSLFFFSYKKIIPLRNINIDISCQLKMKEFFRWVKSKSLILKSKFIMQCKKKWDNKNVT